jgi:hypothetical protein
MPSGETYTSLHSFYSADPRRDRSPEWDYGVEWRGEYDWPRYRVSWVVETGEVYAYRQGGDESVRVLGVVDRVGEYPYSAGHDAWAAFRDAQPIERVLEGWAEQPTQELSWVVGRLAGA